MIPKLQLYRDDLNHPIISGNKLHKLKPNLQMAIHKGCKTVASFGGPYSNHLHALAWACREQGLSSIGIVRGELHENLTLTLQECRAWGMKLIPISRKTYRETQETLHATKGFSLVKDCLPTPISGVPKNAFLIPEGGSNLLAIHSVAEAYRSIFNDDRYQEVTHVICATGTGATLAGLFKASPTNVKVIGVQVVAEGDATLSRIKDWLSAESPSVDLNSLSIVPGHLGGFGKMPVKLLQFIQDFQEQYAIPLDPIYNGKTLFKVAQMFEEGVLNNRDNVLVIHSGGLQGDRN